MDLLKDPFIRGGSLQQGDAFVHGVLFDLAAVMVAYIHIDTDYTAIAADQFQQRRIKNERAPMGDPGLDDQIRFRVPDYFLQGNQVLRKLYNRPAHPFKVVGILVARTVLDPLIGF